MNSLYVEGGSLIHRMPVRAKLLSLLGVSLTLFLTRSPFLLAGGAAIAIAFYASLGLGWRQAWMRIRPVLLTIVVVAAFTLAFARWEEALAVLLRLTTLMLVAATVTATTPVTAFISETTAAARPLERLGLVRAADIGLSIGLVIRFVPEVLAGYHALAEAHRARGLRVRPTRIIVPLIIQTLKAADEIAAAIDARGIRGHKPAAYTKETRS